MLSIRLTNCVPYAVANAKIDFLRTVSKGTILVNTEIFHLLAGSLKVFLEGSGVLTR